MAKKNKKEDIVTLAKERFRQAVDSEASNRSRALDSIRFVDLGEQWDSRTKQDRETNGRPCMVINKCAGVVKKIANDARQNKPRIKVRPSDSKADPQIADILNGLIRNIENLSDADAAYDTGIDQAIKGGWGYWRVVTDYSDNDVFEQDIFIRRIVNQFSVYLDPHTKEADRSDARWGFVTEVLARKEFEKQYPKADAVEWGQVGAGESNVDWFTDDGIRIAEYYYKEPVTKTLWQTLTVGPDGDDYDVVEAGDQEIIEKDGKRYFVTMLEGGADDNEGMGEGPEPEGGIQGIARSQMEQPEGMPPEMMGGMPQMPGLPPQMMQPGMGQGMLPPAPPRQTVTEIVRERTVKTDRLMWCKLAGGEIIEGPIEQAGKYVPIVACIGDEAYIEGEPVYLSAFYHAMDAQRLYNWARSNAVETLALGPKQPFIGTPRMFEDHEAEWDRANTNPKMRLTANMENGMLPQRQPLGLADSGALQEAMQSADDIKSTTGLFDASLGANGNEKSGKAILARQRQSDVSMFHFPDNQARAIRFTGRILVDLIPKIYDTERVVRVLGKDETEGWAEINKRVPDPMSPGGYRVTNDLSVGKYDVSCDVGPAYMTKRLEAADGMMQFLSASPNTAPVVLPRIAKNLDWPEAEEIADELKQIMQPQPPPPDPMRELDMQGKALVNAKRQQELEQGPRSQELVDAKRMQDLTQQVQGNDEKTYQIAQQAIMDAMKAMGLTR
jgi:hypothetical protein